MKESHTDSGPNSLSCFPKRCSGMLVITVSLLALSDSEWLLEDSDGTEQGDCWTRAGQVVLAGPGSLLSESNRRLSQSGSTASHVLLAAARMNYYISFCYLSSCFITERQSGSGKNTTLWGPPRWTLKMREGGFGAGEDGESLHFPLKGGRRWTKTHCLWI